MALKFPLPQKFVFNKPDPASTITSPDLTVEEDTYIGTLTFTDPDDPESLFGQHLVTTDDDRFYFLYTKVERLDDTYEHTWVLIYKAGSHFDHEQEPVINLKFSIESHPDVDEDDRHDPVEGHFTINVDDVNERPVDIILDGAVDDQITIAYADLNGEIHLGGLTVVDPDSFDDVEGKDPDNRFGEVEFIPSQFSSHGMSVRVNNQGEASAYFNSDDLDLRFVDQLVVRVGVKDNPDADDDLRNTAFKSFTVNLEHDLTIDVAENAISINEDQTLYFGRAYGNDITVFGSSSEELSVQITVKHARLKAESADGEIIYSQFDLNGQSHVLSLSGMNIHQMTSFFASLSLTPDQDFVGEINLSILVSDENGQTVSEQIDIDVNNVDDGGSILSFGDEYIYRNNQDRFILKINPNKITPDQVEIERQDFDVIDVLDPKLVYLIPTQDAKIVDDDGYQVVGGFLKIKIIEDHLRQLNDQSSDKSIDYIVLRSGLEEGETGVYQSGNDIYFRVLTDQGEMVDWLVATVSIATLHDYQRDQIAEGYFTRQYIYEFLTNPDPTIHTDDEWEALQKQALENLMNTLQVDGTYEVDLDDVNDEYNDVYVENEEGGLDSSQDYYFIIHEQLISMRFFDGESFQSTTGIYRFLENIQYLIDISSESTVTAQNLFTVRWFYNGDNPYQYKDNHKTKISSENILEVMINEDRVWTKDQTGAEEADDAPLTLTYYLPKTFNTLNNLERYNNFDLLTVDEQTKAYIQSALDHISAMTNINFVEAEFYDASLIDFYFTRFSPSDNVGGASQALEITLDQEASKRAELIILPAYSNNILPEYGSQSQNALLNVTVHEILHGLGLRHPSFQQGTEPAPYLASEFSTFENTIMAYVDQYGRYSSSVRHHDTKINTAIKPETLQDFDLQAIHALYGNNTTTNADDTYYDFTDYVDLYGFIVIHDNGGIDTLDFNESSAIAGVSINLTPGAHSATYYSNNFYISQASVIERVIGTPQHDRIIGNDADNHFEGLAGYDYIDGGYGTDTVTYQRSSLGVNINLSSPNGEQLRDDNPVNQWDHGTGDILLNIENITGSLFDDVLVGNNKANVIDGTRGSDTLTGGYGENTFIVDFQLGFGWDMITDFKRSVDTLILRVSEELSDLRAAFNDGVFDVSKPNIHQFDVYFADSLTDGFSVQFVDAIHQYTSLTDALGVEDIQIEVV